MKNILLYLVFTISLVACYEEPIRISPTQPEPGVRKALIEEFTGVRCVNCPQGTDEILNLQSLYNYDVLAVAIHAGFFAVPYNDSKYDFATTEGRQIESWLGTPIGYPTAVINRKKFEGQSYQLGRNSWAGYIKSEIKSAPVVKIFLEKEYNESNRTVDFSINIVGEEDLDQPLKYSIMVTEDDIYDPQADVAAENGIVTEYKHKHVLRAMLTNFDGDPLASKINKDEIIKLEKTYTIPDENGWWKAENVNILVFVSLDNGGAPGEILNVESIKVTE